MKFQIVALLTLVYLIFAIFYHYKNKTLDPKIIIEYILIATLVLTILQSLII